MLAVANIPNIVNKMKGLTLFLVIRPMMIGQVEEATVPKTPKIPLPIDLDLVG